MNKKRVPKVDPGWAHGIAPAGIVTIGDPMLWRRSPKVKLNDQTRNIGQKMLRLLDHFNAQALAAPQIGFPGRIIAIHTRPTDLKPDAPASLPHVMINPSIVWRSKQMVCDYEGCLSIPGLLGVTPRWQSVKVVYTDLDGRQHHRRFKGYLARAIQHELDHLDGRFYINRMPTMRRLTTKSNFDQYYRSG